MARPRNISPRMVTSRATARDFLEDAVEKKNSKSGAHVRVVVGETVEECEDVLEGYFMNIVFGGNCQESSGRKGLEDDSRTSGVTFRECPTQALKADTLSHAEGWVVVRLRKEDSWLGWTTK
jgi:hypothetical protein